MTIKALLLPMAAVALFHCGCGQAATADSPAFVAAETAFQKARAGNGAATEQAVSAFEGLAAADAPEAPLYRAYLGAAQAMQGREAWLPWNKVRATERGLDTLDKALRQVGPAHDKVLVRGTPVSLEARFVAASTFVAIPDLIFHRADRGRQMLQDIVKSPLYAGAPAEFRAAVQAAAAGR